jgi:hypothetical protein
MAGTLITAAHPAPGEQEALAVVAGLFPATWTVVLRDPQGGRGGGGGSTSDLIVYQGGSEGGVHDPGEDLDEHTVAHAIEVYTPERNTAAATAFDRVRKKLGSQAGVVCVDLRNVSNRRATFENHFDNNLAVNDTVILFDGAWHRVFGQL